MKYQEFRIKNFKAIKNTSINLKKDQLVLLLGVNESGKTSILKAIESFDHSNDPADAKAAFQRIRNKKQLDSVASVECDILVEASGDKSISKIAQDVTEDEATSFILKAPHVMTITREFTFENAVYVKDFYKLDSQTLKKISPRLSDAQADKLCREILKKSPLIIYFEDFKDHIPDYLHTDPENVNYNRNWVSTLEGLFYHADKNVTVKQFESIKDQNARNTALNRVNNALNKQFTSRWNRKLKGTKTIDRVEVLYDNSTKLFKFTAVGKDKETVFDIEERSKGASWYLTFLLKTEFRKKRLSLDHGQTLYLIDEPGSNLHSTAQSNMVHDFRTLSSDSVVIYTTHSQHLIDKANLSNVYIVKPKGESIHAERFQDYVKGKKIDTTFYQPIIDALEVQPFSLDMSWNKALVVEGVSDYTAYRLLFESVLKKKLDFVIMPGTSASNLGTLLSLHIGWGAKVMTLLDYDNAGREEQEKYKTAFPNIDRYIQTLDDTGLADSNKFRLENLFLEDDKEAILSLASMTKSKERISKKEFQNSLYIVANDPSLASKVSSRISDQTKKQFATIYSHITSVLS